MTTEISIPILHTIGALPGTVYALFVLIIIDYITGVCLAVKEKKISSKIGAKGIAAKVLIVCLVALSYIVDTWILDSGDKFSSITILFYCANEIISIFENVNHFGLPLPKKFKEYLTKLQLQVFACSCNCYLIFHSTHEVSIPHVSYIDSHSVSSCAAFLQSQQKKADTHKQVQ